MFKFVEALLSDQWDELTNAHPMGRVASVVYFLLLLKFAVLPIYLGVVSVLNEIAPAMPIFNYFVAVAAIVLGPFLAIAFSVLIAYAIIGLIYAFLRFILWIIVGSPGSNRILPYPKFLRKSPGNGISTIFCLILVLIFEPAVFIAQPGSRIRFIRDLWKIHVTYGSK